MVWVNKFNSILGYDMGKKNKKNIRIWYSYKKNNKILGYGMVAAIM